MSSPVTPKRLCRLIHSARFRYSGEMDLQAGIGQLLSGEGIAFKREVPITKKDRIDFLLAEPGIGIEVKVDGSLSSVIRQLFRYAEHPGIMDLILVTTRMKHMPLPESANGKSLYLVYITSF
jgi:hypothetical protein